MNISLENKSPQFITPRVVYAIINQVFEIRIQAEDVEGEEIVYALLTNGTLITAQITEKGLLTLSNVTDNGTVYIQAKDKRGVQNILVLNVNAIHCPYEHSGRCRQKGNISYPVQPNNYFCQCEEQYTGQHCEVLQNVHVPAEDDDDNTIRIVIIGVVVVVVIIVVILVVCLSVRWRRVRRKEKVARRREAAQRKDG